MSPIRVMLVIEATAGGTARYLSAVIPALVERDIEVHLVYSARRDPSFREEIRRFQAMNVQATEIDMARHISPVDDVIAGWRLRRLIAALRPDVVHLHSSKAGALGRLASVGALASPLYTPHAFAFLDRAHPVRSWIYLMLEKLLARWTGALVAVSESEAQAARLHGLVPPGALHVIPNAVVVSQTQRPLRRPGEPLILGSLGRMEEQKDPQRLVELARELARRQVPVEMRVGGEGPLLEACRKRARGMEHLRFLGHVEDAPEFYASIDVFVLTSRYEGLPYSVLDAMHHSLPVVAFDVPGVRDVVTHAVTGLLTRPGDVRGLADTVVSLVENPALAWRMGAEGAARIAREFRFEQQVDALVELYRRCASTPSTGSGTSGVGR
jgi:glycosyltransferase involved in cell wall biosynthesis